MNGAVYISFFQGQLESVLEQVVQLAVQEISKTVGSSLNALLLETAVKEQENRRLRLQIQAEADEGGPAKSKAGEERQEGGWAQTHGPGGQSSERGLHSDTRRLEQRGRVVDQLKSVMQRVLDFAVSELTKIVEASFDDLLLEITKMEKEQQSLEERLGLERSMERSGARDRTGSKRGRRGSENDSVSPSGSEDNREEGGEKENSQGDPRPSDLSSSQDWVPILDKVFGQRWCGDAWSADQLEGGVSMETGGSGRGPAVPPPLSLEPRPSSPQQDPRWTPLEDMEVFSPDEDEDAPVTAATTSAPPTTTTTVASGPAPSPKARRSSASMLHRLLTLPSQLLEDEDANDSEMESIAISMATEAAAGATETARSLASPAATRDEEDEDDEEEEEERRKKKRRRVWTECEDCGRRFSRVSLLKAHRQSHLSESSPPPNDSPPNDSSPTDSLAASLRCDECGKRFSSNTRLQSHVRTSHAHKQA